MASAAMEEYFGDRKWRVATEVTADVPQGEAVIHFKQGKFEIENGVFHSPCSSARGKKGILLQEVTSDGKDIDESRIAVGVVVLREARKMGAIR